MTNKEIAKALTQFIKAIELTASVREKTLLQEKINALLND